MCPEQLRISSFAIVGEHLSRRDELVIASLLSAGHRPRFALIVTENRSALGVSLPYFSAGGKWLDQTGAILVAHAADQAGAATAAQALYRQSDVPYLFVPSPTDETTERLLDDGSVDAILLTQGPASAAGLWAASGISVIRLHDGPLPEYRGEGAAEWALYHDEPLRVSAQRIEADETISPILGTAPVPVKRGDSLAEIELRVDGACAALACEVMRAAVSDGCPMRLQRPWQGRTFACIAPSDIREELEQRLVAGEYSHYV